MLAGTQWVKWAGYQDAERCLREGLRSGPLRLSGLSQRGRDDDMEQQGLKGPGKAEKQVPEGTRQSGQGQNGEEATLGRGF